ncbi:hypothetical protein ATK36_2119 [Amycolatopsis sulphurea]|uniref:Uncharacterized protein n=2 Tax=Amycolatopsis sulphurea TaxID=76022 RepID=A0A2A9F9B4_9PSEU|nr:hypothetical protein [Amycolatopsis sulphurea]PFG47100.1 hypothetical protein ATK36_2119 [Amycolatopsis sulphurea]
MSQPASGPSWLEGLGFAITDQPGGGGASGGGAAPAGPGFSLSSADAWSMLNQARSMYHDILRMGPHATALTKLTPPADEPGSNGYNKLLVGDGQNRGAFGSGADQVKLYRDYIAELVARLEKALGITEASDDQAGVDVKRVSSEGEGKGFA